MKAIDVIRQRISVRSYSTAPVEETLRRELESYAGSFKTGPFGAKVRIKFLDLETLGRDELRSLGTYGIIKGARLYVLGAVKEGPRALVDLGYSLEGIILKATALGLGTCWLGGTFRRASFALQMELGEDEMLPAITPLGYPAGELSSAERMLRFSAGSRKRKPFCELFFGEDGKTPLDEAETGLYRDSFEAVRMGPSASNRQPWRICRGEEGVYYLYLKENRLYNRLLGKIRIQYLDMGIAMKHFELVALENGLSGQWLISERAPVLPGLEHIATWA